MAADRLRGRHGADGLTLVELLVTMLLMGVLGGLVVTSTVTAYRTADRTHDRLDTVAEARVAVNAVSRSLRTAVRATATDALLREAHPRAVEYLADVASQDAPDLVRIVVDDGELVELRWTADAGSGPAWTFDASPPRRRALLANVPDDLGVFVYRDQDACGAGGTDCPALDATASDQGLSRQDRNGVDRVTLTVAATGPSVDPYELRTDVLLRNQGFVPDEVAG